MRHADLQTNRQSAIANRQSIDSTFRLAEAERVKEIRLSEFRTRLSEILRRVEAHQEVYLVTRRGKPVAVLAPMGYEARPAPDGAKGAWERLKALADRLSESRSSRKSAVREISRMRR